MGIGVDTILDFDATEGDTLDLSAVLSDATGDAVVNLLETGGNTVIQVDLDGSGSFTDLGHPARRDQPWLGRRVGGGAAQSSSPSAERASHTPPSSAEGLSF